MVPAPLAAPEDGVLVDDDTLSPELALIDPEMNLRARLALPDITLTEGQIATRIPTTSYEEIRRVFRESVDVERPRRHWRGPSMLAALAIVAAATATALALPRALTGREASTVSKRLHPAVATRHAGHRAHRARSKSKSAVTAKVHRKVHSRRPTSRSSSTNAPKAKAPAVVVTPRASRRNAPQHTREKAPARKRVPVIPEFAWAPAKGVSGYLVEFLAGSKLVLRARTRVAKLRVSARELGPGRYRWLVWGLSSGGAPTGKALVDSAVTIRRG